LHNDQELEARVGDRIVERVTLHEWPLSCVQRIKLAGGRQWIYKAQYGPTVEADVYARARSELLPRANTLYRDEGYTCTLIEYVDAPMFEDLEPSLTDALQVGREVRAQIDAIEGSLPCYVDIRDEERWRAYIEAMLGELSALIDAGKFSQTTPQMAADLARWATSAPVLEAIAGKTSKTGYVHRDLSADNVLVLTDSYRVIDWQRPAIGPVDLDLVDLLNSLGFDPLPYVDTGVMQIWLLLFIGWLTEAKARWFPRGTSYDQQVADLVARLRALANQA
jgi:hypothetical protein